MYIVVGSYGTALYCSLSSIGATRVRNIAGMNCPLRSSIVAVGAPVKEPEPRAEVLRGGCELY